MEIKERFITRNKRQTVTAAKISSPVKEGKEEATGEEFAKGLGDKRI
jgi:hypothetical protein